MVFKIALLSLFLTLSVNANSFCPPLKVGVIDSGLDLNDPRFENHLCPDGHKNFVPSETIEDLNGHGTHVTGLIQKYAGNGNYCILIYKFYQEDAIGKDSISREISAIKEAIKNGATVINFSGGGVDFSEEEANVIKEHPEVTFVVAAGNDGHNLDIFVYNYYPASLFYKNIIVVGNIDSKGNRVPSSNYSKKIVGREMGQDILSTLPDGKEGRMSGTSMSTAIRTGKIIKDMSRSCRYR